MHNSCHNDYLHSLDKIYCPLDNVHLPDFKRCRHCPHRFNVKDVACYNRGKRYWEQGKPELAYLELQRVKCSHFKNICFSKFQCLAELGRKRSSYLNLLRACVQGFEPALSKLAALQHVPPAQVCQVRQALVEHKPEAWNKLALYLAENSTNFEDHKLVSKRIKRFIRQGDADSARTAYEIERILSKHYVNAARTATDQGQTEGDRP
jgi:hypothetical protein